MLLSEIVFLLWYNLFIYFVSVLHYFVYEFCWNKHCYNLFSYTFNLNKANNATTNDMMNLKYLISLITFSILGDCTLKIVNSGYCGWIICGERGGVWVCLIFLRNTHSFGLAIASSDYQWYLHCKRTLVSYCLLHANSTLTYHF